MKTKFILPTMAVLALISCQKETTVNSPVNQRERVQLTVNVGSAGTKAVTADTPEEAKVNDIQILVFRPEGNLDAYKKAAVSPVDGVSCTAGLRTIYAVVNCPTDLSAVKNLAELNAKTFAFANEKPGGFQMIGTTSKNITATDGNASLTVDRAVAKIHLSNIKTDFQAPAYQDMPFKVTRIYAINVTGNYAVTYPTSTNAPTVNVGRLDQGLNANQEALLLYEAQAPIDVTNGAAATAIDKSFYVYPNYSNMEGKKTRIVVEASLGSKLCYYPLTFDGAIRHNTYYDITGLVIMRPGSEDPNTPVITKDCDFTVNVSDWTTGEAMSTTI